MVVVDSGGAVGGSVADLEVRCGCARQVRRGGTMEGPERIEVTPTQPDSVMDDSAVQSSPGWLSVKTGNFGGPKRGAGDLRTLGYLSHR